MLHGWCPSGHVASTATTDDWWPHEPSRTFKSGIQFVIIGCNNPRNKALWVAAGLLQTSYSVVFRQEHGTSAYICVYKWLSRTFSSRFRLFLLLSSSQQSRTSSSSRQLIFLFYARYAFVILCLRPVAVKWIQEDWSGYGIGATDNAQPENGKPTCKA